MVGALKSSRAPLVDAARKEGPDALLPLPLRPLVQLLVQLVTHGNPLTTLMCCVLALPFLAVGQRTLGKPTILGPMACYLTWPIVDGGITRAKGASMHD